MKRKVLIAFMALTLVLASTACASKTSSIITDSSNTNNSGTTNNSSGSTEGSYVAVDNELTEVTEYESETAIPEDATSINLDEITGDLTIDAEGSYVLSGTLENGKIIVNVDGQVHLYLKGVTVTSDQGSALEIFGKKKKVITLVEGYTNTLTDASSYNLEEDDANACLFSKNALTINGNGTLIINASGSYTEEENGVSSTENAKGINCKDQLKILDSPTITVTTEGDGVRGKESVEIYAANLTIDAGDDGIVSEGNIFILDGNYDITTGGGATTSAQKTSYTGSYKGIKNGSGTINLLGGQITINSLHNGVDSEACVIIDGATVTVTCTTGGSTGGFNENSTEIHGHGVHSDGAIYVESGSLNVTASYEGIEAEQIYINGGEVSVVASDDGFNASSESGNSTACYLAINGGTVYVNAAGDGLDSNGDIDITGGTVVVDGPTDNGNGALDCGDNNNTIDITGGTLLCIGTTGMAENASDASTVTFSGFSISDSISAGDSIEIYDGDTLILSGVAGKNRSNGAYIQVATSDTQSGNTYTCKTSNGSTDFTAGTNEAAGMGGFGGGPGNFNGGGGQGDFNGGGGQGGFNGGGQGGPGGNNGGGQGGPGTR